MPSPRSSDFKGGGGILRRKDATILGVTFTTDNPLFKDSTEKEGAFQWLYGVLTIQEDGREELTYQPLQVGDAEDFEVVLDGQGLSGTVEFGKKSQWGIFMESLSHPKDSGKGFDENAFPVDPEGLVADYRALAGTRVNFDWVKDESKWAKANPRKAKGKDGKPLMKDGKQVTYDRENLVVYSYYGQADPSAKVASKPAQRPGVPGNRPATRTATVAAPSSEDIATLADETITAVLGVAKDRKLSIQKLNVKLLSALGDTKYDAIREPVRTWALDAKNLAGIEGVVVEGKDVRLA